MEKISLMEAGSYLLGIESDAIISKAAMDDFIIEERAGESPLLSLASLLDQESAPALTRSDSFIMEVKTSAEPLTLVVDSLLGEIDPPDRFESLPLLYPELAADCCPQIMIHDGQPVLILDGNGLDSARSRLKNGCGEISLETSLDHSPDKAGSKTSRQPGAALDDKTFKSVVCWTIEKYLAGDSDENGALSVRALPSRTQGVSDELLQRLIDKTLRRCTTTRNETLRRMKNKNIGATA
ncbi:MAG: hypothetical protein ABFR63_07710 [Thermodesulfobacteriota bacterium]